MSLRAAFYVDGFNLYHGISDFGQPHLKWFSVWDYANHIATSNGEQLVSVDYFSAMAIHRPDSVSRQLTYLRALKRTGVIYTLGQFKSKPRSCKKCGAQWKGHEEKESDVNLAIRIVQDANENLADVMYVISADTDIDPAIKLARAKHPQMQFVPILPPNRGGNADRRHLCTANRKPIQMGLRGIERCRLPEQIVDAAGSFECPREYRLTT